MVSSESELICTSMATGTPFISALTSGRFVPSGRSNATLRTWGSFWSAKKDFHFAAPVFIAFVFGIQARKGIGMGEMIHRALAGLQNDFIAAIRTSKRAV